MIVRMAELDSKRVALGHISTHGCGRNNIVGRLIKELINQSIGKNAKPERKNSVDSLQVPASSRLILMLSVRLRWELDSLQRSGSGVPPACSAGHSVWLGKSEKTGNYGTAQNYQVRLGIKNSSSHGIMNHSYTVLQ